MFRALRERDRKERELDTLYQAYTNLELKKDEAEAYFNMRLGEYEKFKKENKLEGIKY